MARLWHEVWVESHAPLVPQLIPFRTLESFQSRLPALLPATRLADVSGAPVGFCAIRNDELYLLFVASSARGSGVAAALLSDGEARLAAGGVRDAWLSCAIGNDRAARFYVKQGWTHAGTMIEQVETSQGRLPLECWRFEKRLV